MSIEIGNDTINNIQSNSWSGDISNGDDHDMEKYTYIFYKTKNEYCRKDGRKVEGYWKIYTKGKIVYFQMTNKLTNTVMDYTLDFYYDNTFSISYKPENPINSKVPSIETIILKKDGGQRR